MGALHKQEIAPAPLDWIEQAVRGHQSRPRSDFEPGSEDWTVESGERHDRFVSIAGTLRHRLALRADEIEEILRVLSPRFGDAPDRDQHIAQVARSMDIYPPGKVPWEVRFGRHGDVRRSSRLELLSLSDAFAAAEEEVDWVIRDLLAAGEKMVIGGPPKSLKTWLASHIARCVAVGGPVLDEQEWTVEKPQAVLFIQEEGSRQRWARRLKAIFEEVPDAPVHYTHRAGFSLLDEQHVDWVADQAKAIQARLILIDPWQRVTPGIKENDSTDTAPAWDAIHYLATETGAAICVLHHSSKGGGGPTMDSLRGSSRMAGEVDLIAVLKKNERGTLELMLDGRDLVRRDAEGGNLEIAYEPGRPHVMRTTGAKIKIGGPKSLTREAAIAVLEAANEPLSTSGVRTAVAERIGENRTRPAVDQTLHALHDEGLVDKDATGKGRPTYWTWRK